MSHLILAEQVQLRGSVLKRLGLYVSIQCCLQDLYYMLSRRTCHFDPDSDRGGLCQYSVRLSAEGWPG